MLPVSSNPRRRAGPALLRFARGAPVAAVRRDPLRYASVPGWPGLKAGGAGTAVERAALADLTHETGDVGWYNADLVNACLRADKARG